MVWFIIKTIFWILLPFVVYKTFKNGSCFTTADERWDVERHLRNYKESLPIHDTASLFNTVGFWLIVQLDIAKHKLFNCPFGFFGDFIANWFGLLMLIPDFLFFNKWNIYFYPKQIAGANLSNHDASCFISSSTNVCIALFRFDLTDSFNIKRRTAMPSACQL